MKLAALVVCHAGDPEQAERDLAPFKSWGSPLMVEVGAMPYPVMNTLLDDGFPAGTLNYWLSSFTRGLPDELIDTMVERFASVPSPMSAIVLEHFHGAVTRIGVTDTAVPHRAEGWNLLIPSVWADPAATEREHRLDARDPRAPSRRHLDDAPVAQLPRRRPGRRRGACRLRAELRAASRAQAALRPGQRLPPQPQHRAVANARTARTAPRVGARTPVSA